MFYANIQSLKCLIQFTECITQSMCNTEITRLRSETCYLAAPWTPNGLFTWQEAYILVISQRWRNTPRGPIINQHQLTFHNHGEIITTQRRGLTFDLCSCGAMSQAYKTACIAQTTHSEPAGRMVSMENIYICEVCQDGFIILSYSYFIFSMFQFYSMQC